MNRPIQVYIQNILKSYKLYIYTKGTNIAKSYSWLNRTELEWSISSRCYNFLPYFFLNLDRLIPQIPRVQRAKEKKHKSKSYHSVWNETNSGRGTSHMKFWFNYLHSKHLSAPLKSQEFQVIHFRCTTLIHIFDYIWMLFDLQTFGKKMDTNTSQSAKKVTDGSKLKSEQNTHWN